LEKLFREAGERRHYEKGKDFEIVGFRTKILVVVWDWYFPSRAEEKA
jgi:hypothetical protein